MTILSRNVDQKSIETVFSINRNSVFDCHLSPHWRQMAIKNTFYRFLIRVRRLLIMFSIAAYPVCSYIGIDQQTILGISILFNVYLSLIGNKYTLYLTIKHTFYSLKFQTLVDCQKSLD